MIRLGLLLLIIAKVSCTVPTTATGDDDHGHHDLRTTEPSQRSSPAAPVLSKDTLQKLLKSYFPTATLSSAGDGYDTSCEVCRARGQDEQEDESPTYQQPQPPRHLTMALPPGGFPQQPQPPRQLTMTPPGGFLQQQQDTARGETPPEQLRAGVPTQAYRPEQETRQRPYHRGNENNQNEYQKRMVQRESDRRPVQGGQYGQRELQGLDKQTIVQSLHRIYHNNYQAQDKDVQNQQQRQESVGGLGSQHRFTPSDPQPFNPRVFAHQRPQLLHRPQQEGPASSPAGPFSGYPRAAPATGDASSHPGQTARAPSSNYNDQPQQEDV